MPASRRRPFVAAIAVGITLALLAGCTGGGPKGEASSADPATEPTEATTTGSDTSTTEPVPSSPLGEDPAVEARVDELLSQMTLEEKVGQTVQADIASVTPDEVRDYHLGSVLAGGSSDPGGQIDAPPAAWLSLVDELYLASVDPDDGRTAVPILFGIDAVHGNSNVAGATLFPHNIGLGATRNAELVEAIGEATAIESRVTGVDWVFAPTVAVPQDLRWGRTYEGYAEDPEVVAELGPAIVRGLQGDATTDDYLGPRQVLATVKHFVGDGGTTEGDDQGDTDLSDDELIALHGAAYPPAIDQGAGSVMASFNSVRGQKMHGNEDLLTGYLKGDLGFDGFVISDWNGHGQVPGCTNTDCTESLADGVDMVMAPATWKGYYQSLMLHMLNGDVPQQRLDDAVRRILRIKVEMGLLEADLPSERPLGGEFDQLANPEHRALARQAVRESLVLLKNQDGVLPLDPGTNIVVTGSAAHDVSRQSGGWTLTWQGTGTDRSMFPNATTIWEGLEDQIDAAGGTATLLADDSTPAAGAKPDAAIVVFGEEPYAEGLGDVATLAPDDAADLALMRQFQADGVPVVAVLLSGRPLWVNRELNAADAFVAAWLPGSEGGGVADVLLRDANGDVQFQPTGTLSFSWPARADQFTAESRQADGLFPLGFGLSYDDDGSLEPLPELAGQGSAGGSGAFFDGGRLADGASFVLVDGSGAATTVPATGLLAGPVSMAPADRLLQEDARRITWAMPGRFEVVSDPSVDLASAAADGDLLVMDLLVHATGSGPISFGMACDGPCRPVDATAALADAGTKWTTFGVPLRCLGPTADLADVDRPLVLSGASGLDLSVSAIRLAQDAAVELTC